MKCKPRSSVVATLKIEDREYPVAVWPPTILVHTTHHRGGRAVPYLGRRRKEGPILGHFLINEAWPPARASFDAPPPFARGQRDRSAESFRFSLYLSLVFSPFRSGDSSSSAAPQYVCRVSADSRAPTDGRSASLPVSPAGSRSRLRRKTREYLTASSMRPSSHPRK